MILKKSKPVSPSLRPEYTLQKPGGKVQPEKHTIIKTDRGEFKFREPKSSKPWWK